MTAKKKSDEVAEKYGEEKEQDVPQLETPNLEFEIDEEPKKKGWFFGKFKKSKPKSEDEKFTPGEDSAPLKSAGEENAKPKVKTFWDYVITIITTIVATMAVTVLLYTIISNSAEKKRAEEREVYLKTVYQIGDVDVPSFEYFIALKPVQISDTKVVNVDDPSQTVSYTFVFESIDARATARANYILILKQKEFIVTGETISRSFNEGKVIVNATFVDIDDVANSLYLFVVSFSRNI